MEGKGEGGRVGRGGRRRRGEVMPAPPDEATPFLFLSATGFPLV